MKRYIFFVSMIVVSFLNAEESINRIRLVHTVEKQCVRFMDLDSQLKSIRLDRSVRPNDRLFCVAGSINFGRILIATGYDLIVSPIFEKGHVVGYATKREPFLTEERVPDILTSETYCDANVYAVESVRSELKRLAENRIFENSDWICRSHL